MRQEKSESGKRGRGEISPVGIDGNRVVKCVTLPNEARTDAIRTLHFVSTPLLSIDGHHLVLLTSHAFVTKRDTEWYRE